VSAAVAAWIAATVLTSAVGVWAVYRAHEPLVWRELKLPEDLAAEPITALLRHVAAVRQGPVLFTVLTQPGAVRFALGAPERVMQSVLAAASGFTPGLQAEAMPAGAVLSMPPSAVVCAARVGWGGRWPLLRQKEPELCVAGLLGALASVRQRERLQLMVRLWPVGRVNRPAAASERGTVAPNPWFVRPWWPAEPPREEVATIRAKYGGLLLRSEIVIVAEASGSERAAQLTQRLIAALRTAGGSRGVLRWRAVGGSRAGRVLARQRAPLPWELSTVLAPEELTGILGLPLQAPLIAGISYGVAPRLLAPASVPSSGRVLAVSTWPEQSQRSLAQPIVGALQHTAIVGPTGSGKSTLVARLVEADIRSGRGALVVDLKGDLVADLLCRLPVDRQDGVIVLEPAREGSQPGLQLFAPGADAELTADLLLGTLRELFADSWGVRSSQYLGLGLRTLAALPSASLVELPWLFADKRLRDRALERAQDPWLAAAWQRFDSLAPADQAAQLASPLNKLEELVNRRRLRAVLGQSSPRLDFREVLARNRIVLVSLPPGLLGRPAVRLLSALTLWQFFQAVEARAGLPIHRRPPFMIYVDEVAVLTSLPLPLEGLLERARGHGVGLTLSPQALSQLSQSLRASLLANVGSLVSFQQVSEDEACVLAKALPGVSASQLQHLGPFEVAMRLSLAPGRVTPTMTGRTLPPGPRCSDPEQMRRIAAERYGQSVADTDAALARRYGLTPAGDADTRAAGAPAPGLGVSRRRS
jgi:Helicase HerA, central domain